MIKSFVILSLLLFSQLYSQVHNNSFINFNAGVTNYVGANSTETKGTFNLDVNGNIKVSNAPVLIGLGSCLFFKPSVINNTDNEYLISFYLPVTFVLGGESNKESVMLTLSPGLFYKNQNDSLNNSYNFGLKPYLSYHRSISNVIDFIATINAIAVLKENDVDAAYGVNFGISLPLRW